MAQTPGVTDPIGKAVVAIAAPCGGSATLALREGVASTTAVSPESHRRQRSPMTNFGYSLERLSRGSGRAIASSVGWEAYIHSMDPHRRVHVHVEPTRRCRVGAPEFPDPVAPATAVLPPHTRAVLPNLPN